jgi:hypothetical protein
MVSTLEFVAGGSPVNLLSLFSTMVAGVHRSVRSRQFGGGRDGDINSQAKVCDCMSRGSLGLQGDADVGRSASWVHV